MEHDPKLILYPDSMLHKKCRDINPEEIKDFASVIDKMKSIMFAFKGRGLAGPQVGLPLNIFIATLGADNVQVFINPEIIEKSNNVIPSREGCLSIPGVNFNLKSRYEQIRIKALDENGEEFSLLLNGPNSVIVQHEYDHLFGTLLFDRVGSAQRGLRKSQYTKRLKKFGLFSRQKKGKRNG